MRAQHSTKCKHRNQSFIDLALRAVTAVYCMF